MGKIKRVIFNAFLCVLTVLCLSVGSFFFFNQNVKKAFAEQVILPNDGALNIQTVADAIETVSDFPKTTENGWDNGNGVKAFLSDDGTLLNFGSYCIPVFSKLVKTDDGYSTTYECSRFYTHVFRMENDVLQSIELSGFSGSVYAKYNGVYTAPHKHDFCFFKEGNVITAQCSNIDGKCGLTDAKTTLSVIPPSSLVYDGSAKEFTFTDGEKQVWISLFGNSGIDISYTAKEGSDLKDGKAVSAGNYTVIISVESLTLTLDFTISKMQVGVPDKDTNVYYYMGEEITYVISNSELYEVSGNKRISADTYTVTVSLKDTANYEWTNGKTDNLEYPFAIKKAENKITNFNVKSWAVGETPVLPTADSTFGDVQFIYSKGEPISFLIDELPKDPGHYVVKAYVIGNNDYESVTKELEFDIFEIPHEPKISKSPTALIIVLVVVALFITVYLIGYFLFYRNGKSKGKKISVIYKFLPKPKHGKK